MHNKGKGETSNANVQQLDDAKDQERISWVMRLVVLTDRVDAGCLNMRAEIQHGWKTENDGGQDP